MNFMNKLILATMFLTPLQNAFAESIELTKQDSSLVAEPIESAKPESNPSIAPAKYELTKEEIQALTKLLQEKSDDKKFVSEEIELIKKGILVVALTNYGLMFLSTRSLPITLLFAPLASIGSLLAGCAVATQLKLLHAIYARYCTENTISNKAFGNRLAIYGATTMSLSHSLWCQMVVEHLFNHGN